ncbi:MAG: ATP-binding protein [Paracoccus sp. (in: a-proteobacteria)]|nr:ATP-binding protein [Paracoccus sp. (in: a-proteobacteria)]
MKRLSSYFFRVATLAAFVAFVTTLCSYLLLEALSQELLLSGLRPDQIEMMTDYNTELDAELLRHLNAFSQSWHQQLMMPFCIALGLMVGGMVGLAHSRRLFLPIDAVANAAALLAKGESHARAGAAPTGIVEVDDFVRDFDRMAAEIQKLEQNMREWNAAIAHELRTPLTVLMGRINGMADGVFAMDRAGLDLLLTQTEQLHRIVEDLQLVTMTRAGRFDLAREPVDLAVIAAGHIPELGPDGHDLRPAPTLADPQRMRQILAALIDNARRYGAPPITLATGTEHDCAFLTISDRGPGMTPEDAARAFDSFWRADKSRDRASGGSGLGLAVVKSLVRSHGGTVHCRNRPDGGAIFRIELPLSQSGSAAPRRLQAGPHETA